MKEEDKISTKQVARILGVHYQTVINWRKENRKILNGKKPFPDLKYLKIGDKVLYYKDFLMEYIRKHTFGGE